MGTIMQIKQHNDSVTVSSILIFGPVETSRNHLISKDATNYQGEY